MGELLYNINMKILSLFDGMSVAQKALKDAGIPVEVYYASEIDEYAMAVTQSNFPNTVQLGDVSKIKKENYINHPIYGIKLYEEKIDLLIGGSPCQDLSIAKANRKGLDGSRSGLFWEYVRILKEVKPKYFILENVASMPKEAKDIISETLGVQPVMINASLVSAQNRKRLFWVGERIDTFECKNNGSDNPPITKGECFYRQVEIPQPEDMGILLRHILEPKVDESFYVKDKSNTIRTSGRGSGVDDKHNWDTIRIGSLNSGGQGDRIYSQNGKSVSLSANGGGRGAKTGLYAVGVASRTYPRTKIKGQERIKQIEVRSDEKSNAMTSVQGDSMVMQDTQIRKLTPIECLRLQSMPDNYFDKATYKGKPISNTQRYKMCGNAFNKEVIVHILKSLI